MPTTNWRRIVPSGALWALVYNCVWGVAWFAFMRTEWINAAAALGREIPWTSEVWFLWVVLTIPMGIAVVAYTAGHAQEPRRAALAASITIWVLFTLGMAIHGQQESLSVRVIALDSAVNLAGMITASFAGVWALRD
jgi:hypothetical protein